MVDRITGELHNSVGDNYTPQSNRTSGSWSAAGFAQLQVEEEVQDVSSLNFQEYKKRCREEYDERWKNDDKILQEWQDAHRARLTREYGEIDDLSDIDQSA